MIDLDTPRSPADPVPALRDADGEIVPAFVQAVDAATRAGDSQRLRDLVGDLHEADQGALLEALEAELRPRLIGLLGEDFDFAALTEVDEAVREEILEELSAAAVAEGVRDLDSDDAVVILDALDREEQEEVLEALPPTDRVALQKSLDYAEYTAGRLMQTDLVAVPPFWTVGMTLDHLQAAPELPDSFFEVFVVDPGHRLLGHAFLDRLVRSSRDASIDSIMTAVI